MAKEEGIILEWVVDKILWWWTYSVVLDWWMVVHAKPKGKLKQRKIKIIPWDKVQVQLNEIDPTKGYIVYRL